MPAEPNTVFLLLSRQICRVVDASEIFCAFILPACATKKSSIL
uniref:Uncharacterized protein n=1 Tax=Arundo donax TaxID=35708 RepID=A0A0A9AYN4_ARUDO